MDGLGFVGTGTIAAAIVEGLRAAGMDTPILLSPRNAEAAARLAARHAHVRVAETNQAVLDGSAMVVLAVRPQIADAVLPALRFRPDHHVLSVIATMSLDSLRTMTAPAGRVTRAVPLPAVAMRRGPTAIFPDDAPVRALFDRLGSAIVLEKEAEFDLFSAATATMASYFAFAGTIARWMERGGVDPGKARAFTGQMLEGLAGTGPGRDFAALADEHQTRGGLNEQVVRQIAPDGFFPALDAALDDVLARVRAAPPSTSHFSKDET
jgi:pyrroline-5-carboxylate reductase